MSKKGESSNQKIIQAAGLGLELVGLIVVLIYAGQYFDKKQGWPGYGMIIGGLLALTIWLVHVIRIAKSVEEGDRETHS